MIIKSDKYTENDILKLESYDKTLDISKLIEKDFCNLVDDLDLQNTEKELLKRLFYKYGTVNYILKECE